MTTVIAVPKTKVDTPGIEGLPFSNDVWLVSNNGSGSGLL